MRISEVTKFPVSVTLNKKNPYNNSIKVNNILVSLTQPIVINTKEELNRLLPIDKYLVIEYIEVKEVVTEVKEVKEVKKTRKKKSETLN